MKPHLSSFLLGAALVATGAQAGTFSPNFSDYSFPGTAFTVDAAANTFFTSSYGITLSNVYLYKDSRDTFDGIGIANGTVAEVGSFQSGRIDFADLTDFVTVDFAALRSTTYSVYSGTGALLSTQTVSGSPQTGTFTLRGSSSSYIAYLTFASTGGYGGISNLVYNYDGTTGGGNVDLPPVPEPATFALMLLGLSAIGLRARRARRD